MTDNTDMFVESNDKSQALAPSNNKGLVHRVAQRFGVDPNKMLNTLKTTAFRQQGDVAISNEQMMALLIVSDQYKLNPFTREIYAFPDKNNGIVPIVGVDGWSRIINSHDQFDGMEFFACGDLQTMPDAKPAPEWIECIMHRKDRKHPIIIREYLDEVYRPMSPWKSHTKRMLRHKAMIQAARFAFGFVGIFDEDEAERVIEGDVLPNEPGQTQGKAADLNAKLNVSTSVVEEEVIVEDVQKPKET